MAYNIKTAKREFIYEDRILDDPNPEMTPERVKEHFTAFYPELVNAKVTGPVFDGVKATYTFGAKMGKKG